MSDKVKVPAAAIVPHQFNTKVVAKNGTPVIYVSQKAHSKIYYYTSIAEHQLMWLGSVVTSGKDLVIKDVFLFPVEVNYSKTCDISAEGMTEFLKSLANENKEDPHFMDTLRLIMHTHIDDDLSATTNDKKHLEIFSDGAKSFCIQGMVNKKGQMGFNIFFEGGFDVYDAQWAFLCPVLPQARDAVEKEISDKITEKYASNVTSNVYDFGYPKPTAKKDEKPKENQPKQKEEKPKAETSSTVAKTWSGGATTSGQTTTLPVPVETAGSETTMAATPLGRVSEDEEELDPWDLSVSLDDERDMPSMPDYQIAVLVTDTEMGLDTLMSCELPYEDDAEPLSGRQFACEDRVLYCYKW